jgi:WD40 repeat protein/DNA polymerase III delta prime subunit
MSLNFVLQSYRWYDISRMPSKVAIERLAPLVRAKLSRTNQARLDQILALLDRDGQVVLGNALRVLFPGRKKENALAGLRQFRAAVDRAAEKAVVRFSIKADGNKGRAPTDRDLWFECDDRVSAQVTKLVDADTSSVKPSPLDVLDSLRFFTSYAHKDAKLKKEFLETLDPLLQTHPHVQFGNWSDVDILPGQKWLREIKDALGACDFGLLLVSPAFLASRFIRKNELQYLLKNKSVIPVAIEKIFLDGTMDLKGLESYQIFFDRGGKSYGERSTGNPRKTFVAELYQRIFALTKLNLERGSHPQKPLGSRREKAKTLDLRDVVEVGDIRHDAQDSSSHVLDHFRGPVVGFDKDHFVPTEGVSGTLSKTANKIPEPNTDRRRDAIESLMEWLNDEKAPPYSALLGEYGMGKTTTCKALARELLDRREKGETVRLPIYLDLRYVGESAKRELVLDEILELIIKRSWKRGPGGTLVTPKELTGLVQNEGALVIWDGLDEVLVHLDPNPGQMFTRQLFRILPPVKKGERRRGRMLISCRTHFFRTLRDQQTHFRAEDRDNVRAEDYRAPFVLLPFTESQIRKYIEQTFGSEHVTRVMETLEAVHNLKEMSARPYTLSLIAEQFAQIEQWKAEGRRVTGLTLYRHMVLSWLERDQGKHQLTPDHKQALMEHYSAELWRSGAKSWSVGDLEQWLVDFLEARPGLAAHYKLKDPELLKEDLRTATFLVRDDDHFRFAHTSLQEYFLAGYLRRALVEGRPEAWALPRVSRETLDFLGQWLEESDGRTAALETLERLRDSYRLDASELAFEYFLLAHRKRYLAPSAAGFQLPGTDLSEWEIEGSVESPLMLTGLNLAGARLWNSHWQHCNLGGAKFDDVGGLKAELLDCYLRASSWRRTDLEATVFRDCDLSDADFQDANCDRTEWLRCGLDGTGELPAGRPQGLYALCGGTEPDKDHQPCRVAVATGHYEAVWGCAWSPDSRRIVSASSDNTLRIWDAQSGKLLVTLAGHQDTVLRCAWSPDSRRIVSASEDHMLRIWDAQSGKSLATLAGHESIVWGCAWSPDSGRIVSASADKTLRIWDAHSGESLATLSGHQDSVRACAWSPDSRRIASASNDKTLRIWDAQSGKPLVTLAAHQESVLGCAWSPDSRRIVSASEAKMLRIWDAQSGKLLAILAGHEDSVAGCAWSPNGLRIITASDDDTLRIWDARSGKSLATLAGHEDCVEGCAWSPNGKRILSASVDETLGIWDAESGKSLTTLAGHQASVRGCAWSPDSRRIVSASADKTLQVWDAQSGESLVALVGHQDPVWNCAWSPDSSRIVSASDDNTLRIWDAQSGKPLAILAAHQASVWGCAWSPDSRKVVSASYDGTLRMWEAQSGESLAILAGHKNGVRGCAWSADSRRIVSASYDSTLRIWNAQSGKSLATLNGHESAVWGCAWSPDSRWIVSASSDNTLRIWDAQSGKSLATLPGHDSTVWSCAWSPDSRRIVSASDDHTLRIWDAQSGKSLATLPGHDGTVWGCAWSSDSRRIVSASDDGTLRMWNAEAGTELAPTMYHLSTRRGGPTWASVDYPANRIVGCGAEAWRSLGWVVAERETGLPEWLPAETFGALPVVE